MFYQNDMQHYYKAKLIYNQQELKKTNSMNESAMSPFAYQFYMMGCPRFKVDGICSNASCYLFATRLFQQPLSMVGVKCSRVICCCVADSCYINQLGVIFAFAGCASVYHNNQSRRSKLSGWKYSARKFTKTRTDRCLSPSEQLMGTTFVEYIQQAIFQ